MKRMGGRVGSSSFGSGNFVKERKKEEEQAVIYNMMYGFWIFSPMEFRSVTVRVRYPYGNLSTRHVSSLWKCGWEGSGRRAKELEMKIDVEHVWFNHYASRHLHNTLHNHCHIGIIYGIGNQ